MARRSAVFAGLVALAILTLPGCASWRAPHQADPASTSTDPAPIKDDGGLYKGFLQDPSQASMADWNFHKDGG